MWALWWHLPTRPTHRCLVYCQPLKGSSVLKMKGALQSTSCRYFKGTLKCKRKLTQTTASTYYKIWCHSPGISCASVSISLRCFALCASAVKRCMHAGEHESLLHLLTTSTCVHQTACGKGRNCYRKQPETGWFWSWLIKCGCHFTSWTFLGKLGWHHSSLPIKSGVWVADFAIRRHS